MQLPVAQYSVIKGTFNQNQPMQKALISQSIVIKENYLKTEAMLKLWLTDYDQTNQAHPSMNHNLRTKLGM